MARSAAGIAVILILSMMAAQVAEGREMLAKKNKGTCEKPPTNKVKVPKGIDVIVLKGEGDRVFYCNGGKIEVTEGKGRPHGEVVGVKLVSDDKLWKGKFTYRESDGKGEYVIKNKETGEKMTVVASQKPQAREDAPNGSALTWDRRGVEEYKFNGEGPEIKYVIRNDTESKKIPSKCKGDIDEYVPFSATYTFVAC